MNILLIDGGKAFGHSAGRLNHTLHQTARDTLSALGHHVRETVIDDGVRYSPGSRKIPVDGCGHLADARLVDARAVDREKVYGRGVYRRRGYSVR